MAYKIYKAGSFLIIEDTVNGTLLELNSSNIQIKKEKTNINEYSIINSNGQSMLKVNLEYIYDANKNPYTENDWDVFRFEQVGAQNTTDVSAVKPKVYKALLTQSGTSAPTAVVLENTLGDVNFEYGDVGSFSIISNDLFTENKTFFNIQPTNTGSYISTNLGWSASNALVINVIDVDTALLINGALTKTPILIEVYP